MVLLNFLSPSPPPFARPSPTTPPVLETSILHTQLRVDFPPHSPLGTRRPLEREWNQEHRRAILHNRIVGENRVKVNTIIPVHLVLALVTLFLLHPPQPAWTYQV